MGDTDMCLSPWPLKGSAISLVGDKQDPLYLTRHLTLMGSRAACVQLTFTGVYSSSGCGVRETNKTQFLPSASGPLSWESLRVLFFNKPKPLSLMTKAHDSMFQLCQSLAPSLVCGTKHGGFSCLRNEDPDSSSFFGGGHSRHVECSERWSWRCDSHLWFKVAIGSN